jgi:hypothetical protein
MAGQTVLFPEGQSAKQFEEGEHPATHPLVQEFLERLSSSL